MQVTDLLAYLNFVSSSSEIGLNCPWVIAEVCLGGGHLERRLRAIFAADVSGYGRLTSADEEGTHVRLKEHLRVLVDPKISEHGGRIVKNTGDGMLAEFSSAVDAVRCAVDIQHGMAERNADVPQEKRIEFRIGINVGEIIIDSGDIFGDDVNVAVRLEGLADPGSICVSARVHEHVKDQIDVCFEDAGERQLKNVTRLVRVYQVLLDLPSGAALSQRQRRPGLTATAKPSIAVLPLTNMTGNAEMESFCDSFSDDVIANLSRFHELSVIARHSSFAFKGSQIGVAEIGEKLGARYLLEGSLIRSDRSISINIHLIDVLTSYHIWGEPFEGEIESSLGFEREVTRRVVNLLPAYIEAAERMRVRRLDAADLQSLDYVLRGLESYEEHTREGHARAAEMFEKAIECDPNYARAYAALSRVHNHRYRYRWADDPEASLRTSLSLARTAVRLDPGDPKSLSELGQVLLFMKDVEAALSCYRRALALNPNDADVIAHLGEALGYADQSNDALNLIDEAINRNPFPPDEHFWFKADALFSLERYQEVIETARLMQDPTEVDRLVAASYALTGAFEKAREHAAFVLRKHPEFRIGAWIARQPDSRSEVNKRFAAGLRLAGLPD